MTAIPKFVKPKFILEVKKRHDWSTSGGILFNKVANLHLAILLKRASLARYLQVVYSSTIVCAHTPPAGDGGGGGVEPPTEFSKKKKGGGGS